MDTFQKKDQGDAGPEKIIHQSSFPSGTELTVDFFVSWALREGQLTFLVKNSEGLNMRNSNQIVIATNKWATEVTVTRASDATPASAQGNSMLDLLLLTVPSNQQVIVSAHGGESRAFWNELVQLDFWEPQISFGEKNQ